MTPEIALIIGFLLCAAIVVVFFIGKYQLEKHLSKQFADFRLQINDNLASTVKECKDKTKFQLIDFERDISKKIAAIPQTAVEVEKDEKPKDFWNDKRQLKEWANRVESGEAVEIPNLPQLGSLTPNDAYHAIQDRLEELDQ